MNITKKEKYLISVLFIFMTTLAVIRNSMVNEPGYSVIWFCDLVPLLLAIAFLLEDTQLVKGIICFGLLPQVYYMLDVFLFLIVGGKTITLFGIVLGGYGKFLAQTIPIDTLTGLVLHIFPLGIALLYTYKDRPTKKAIAYSALTIGAVYLMTLLLTSSKDIINFVYNVPTSPMFSAAWYIILWPVLNFVLLALPTYYLQYLLYKKSKPK